MIEAFVLYYFVCVTGASSLEECAVGYANAYYESYEQCEIFREQGNIQSALKGVAPVETRCEKISLPAKSGS